MYESMRVVLACKIKHSSSGAYLCDQARVHRERHGSDWIKRVSKYRGSRRINKSQHTSSFSRVGSGQLTRLDPTRPVRFDLSREKP